MVSAPPPLSATDAFALIMERLYQAVAARSYRGQMAGPLILLICTRLRRLAARFAALAARVRAGTLRSRAPARRAASRPASPPASPPPPRLPNDFAWLVRLVGREAAGCGSQLQFLLTDPEFAALIAAAPQMGRLLRPLCRMLGVDASALPPPSSRRAASPGRAPAPDQIQADQIEPDQIQPGRTPADPPPAATPLAGTPGRSPGPRRERVREVRLPALLGLARA